MTRSSLRPFVLAVPFLLAAAAPAQGTPIGFPEEFALASDRAKALEQLVPGTPEHSYYLCLHLQQTGQFDAVPPVLNAWIQRHGKSDWTTEIQHRQALLTFDRDPAGTLAYLRHELGLRFDHQRVTGGMPPHLPTRLDPALLDVQALTERAWGLHPDSVEGFTEAAFDALASAQLDANRLTSLLSRLRRPDVPNLPALVVRNLEDPRSGGFGSLPIHERLLLAQLEECARLRPSLLGDDRFLAAWLRRLRPSEDVQWRNDPAARLAYLERLQAFVDRLAPAQNSLKAHVAYHRLLHDLSAGTYDLGRLLGYLRLPRVVAYVPVRFLERHAHRADLTAQFATGLPPVAHDEDVVRRYLAHFLRDADGIDAFREFVDNDYLRRLLAETKILAGIGDMQRWYALLDDPAYYERLKERVEIEFVPTQPEWFAADAPVAVEVDVKNVPTLLLRVFEIHTLNYYRDVGKEVDASIELDGLVANVEKTFEYDEGPLRRVRRRFELPEIASPGVYVVELIGGGTSSRAVFHKGRLQYTERLSAAGHALRVLDEAGVHLRDASVWFGSREYRADADGEILLPYSTAPGSVRLVLNHGDLATLTTLAHRAEHYELDAGIHVEREALLAGNVARVLVRPRLLVDGRGMDIDLLQQPTLVFVATDVHGVATTQEVRGIELHGDRETAHELRVPAALQTLSVSLRGKVKNLSLGQEVELATPAHVFAVNGIDATDLTACPLLSHTAAGWVLDVRGKEGEPLADRAVQVVLQHREFTDPIHASLKTDAQGRIHLGALAGVVALHASGFPAGVGAFDLREHARTWPARLTGVAGDTLRVPYQGDDPTVSRTTASLLEVRGGCFVRDAFAKLALAGGFLELRDLEPGDYDLWLEEADVHIQVNVTAGTVRDGWATGRDRVLEVGAPELHIVGAAVEGDALVVRLARADSSARVHVLAGRYLPPFDAFAALAAGRRLGLSVLPIEHGEATYHSGREISDEYRYILERRFAQRFPGNMLQRPSLLLNRWALEETWTAMGLGGGAGGKFGGRAGGRGRMQQGGPAAKEIAAPVRNPGTFPVLDFLPTPAMVLANLRPDAAGVVRVPLTDLGDDHYVRVLAVDDDSTVQVTVVRAETPLAPKSRDLAAAIPPERHVAEQRRIEFLAAGASAVVGDATHARAQTFDSLAAVFWLLLTLAPDAGLSDFAFVLEWPSLPVERKRELYSQHACHELHFFLQQKDPPFFASDVQPFLANKLHKTFLDEWLLGADLRRHLEPRAFARLNVVERILLLRRLPDVSAAVRRSISESFALLPPDLERAAVLFDSALQAGALDNKRGLQDDIASLEAIRAGAGEGAEKRRDAARPPAAAAPQPDAAPADEAEEEIVEELAKKEAGRAEREAQNDKDARNRETQRRLFRAPEPTRRYVEHNYRHVPIEAQDAGLVTVDAFWRDFAAATPGEPFVSSHVAEAAGTFAEMMFALAVLDLPFTSDEHETSVDGNAVRLTAKSPLLLVRKEIVDAQPAVDADPVLVAENFYRLDERFRFVGNEKRDAWVTGEFLVGVPYGCQVVVTNPTSAPRKLELLLQIPEGAIPVRAGFYTRGRAIAVEPYGTASFDYAFYFPEAGAKPHYPVHVSEAGRVVAFATPRVLTAVTELSTVDTGSWEWVSQNGSNAEVLAFLETANLQRLDLAKIAFRLRDREFFTTVVGWLREHFAYVDTLWSYGIHHGDVATIREYLRHADRFVRACGPWLESPLLVIDPIERRAYQHVEFDPLFNPRAHRFGKQRELLNPALARHYLAFLSILTHRPALDDVDWFGATYYLLLQDRVQEALQSFARVDPAGLPTRVQFDYTRAYLGFFGSDPSISRRIANEYRTHPVPHWRMRFLDVLRQLDEAEALARGAAAPGNGAQAEDLAASEPVLELEVAARRVTVRYRGVERCEVSYYRMDVEFLFSTHPFVQQGDGAFAHIRPNRSEVLALPADRRSLDFDLPAEYHNANVLVEVRAAGLTRRQAYYANSLTTHFIESHGQLQVTAADGKPLPRVYVKVYVREGSGRVRFFKDGYTDLRGRFDYASLSGDSTAGIDRFAVLVLSDDRGATIREVEPPQR